MSNNQVRKYDVVIIGTGIGGTTLGAILARHGLRVAMIDSGTHPRFAVGESTIATTTLTLELMAMRFDVPELKHITSIAEVSENVMPSCGVKRNFGFVYHREHTEQNPQEVNQALVVNEVHYFRQDIDAYMLHVAIRYGCDAYQNTVVDDIRIDAGGVTVTTRGGLTFEADFVADGAGYRSVLADKLGLRETPCRAKTHARGLFTHMIDVKPFDACREVPKALQQPVPWHQGTLHHLFDGGWMWVIPFNNTPESKNPLVSVGLMLDPRKHPKPDVRPEQEFADFIAKHPDMARQFADARAVREWVSSGRIQYSASACTGDRFCLLSHATGFIDPLFSRGLFNTMQTTNALAGLLIEAAKDRDFSKARFAPVEKLQQGLIDFNDRLVNCSYLSWGHYPLWNAWFRLWLLTGNYGQLHLQRAMMKYRQTGDARWLEPADALLPGAFTTLEPIVRLFEEAAVCVERYGAGELSGEAAERAIYALLEENAALLPPFFDFVSPAERITWPSTPEKIAALLLEWVERLPEDVRAEYFDYDVRALLQQPVVKDTITADVA